MNNNKLAIFGGEKSISEKFKRYNPIGKEEIDAAIKVLKTGKLSPFLGEWEVDTDFGGFFGGEKVQEFERLTEREFNVNHAITVNSATSGLVAAIGAAGISPGDEVIVSPWTMCATATAILCWNAIPVFADIEDETFNLDPSSIRKNITNLTKAIVVTDIFGHPALLDEILEIASEFDLVVIEDCSQSPKAKYKGKFAGTVAHIGILSLNFHKHIHTGEGGICLTDDSFLAERMQLIRNHGEAVVEKKGVQDLTNMIGFNFRLGEIEASIGIEQFKKMDGLIGDRIAKAEKLREGLANLRGLRLPIVKDECTHVYYVFPILVDEEELGCSRDVVFNALVSEGVPIGNSYSTLHLLPMYQNKIAYGSKGFPWVSEIYKGKVKYDKGICPVAEELNDKRYMGIAMCSYEYSNKEIDSIIFAFKKVWDNIESLK